MFRSVPPIIALFQMERYKITRFEQYKTDVEQCDRRQNESREQRSDIVRRCCLFEIRENSKPTKRMARLSG